MRCDPSCQSMVELLRSQAADQSRHRLAVGSCGQDQVRPAQCLQSGGGITRLPIHAGQLATESRSVLGFILRGDEPIGFVFVAGLEGFLFARGEVFAVENAPGAEEDAVALFHVLSHVVNMNQLDPSPSASSGRGRLGL